MVVTISAASTEYVRVPIRAKADGVTVDPTGDTVKLAFMAATTAPGSGDLKTGSWETDASGATAVYYARCLVGPDGGITLTADTYTVWVQIQDSPETPLIVAGLLKVV